MAIYKVGHTDDGYSYVLVEARDEEEAKKMWLDIYVGVLREHDLDDDPFMSIAKSGPNVVECFNKVVILDDGGYSF